MSILSGPLVQSRTIVVRQSCCVRWRHFCKFRGLNAVYGNQLSASSQAAIRPADNTAPGAKYGFDLSTRADKRKRDDLVTKVGKIKYALF